MLRLTIPVLIEQVLHLLVGLVDMWLTGKFLPGEAYMAAMTLMIYALWLVGNVFGFVALGSTALTARFVGAGKREMANRVMNQSMTSGLIWSAVLVGMAIPLAGYFPILMGLDGLAARAAHQYLVIELCVLPAVMVERVAVACLRGAGDMVSGLVVMAIVNVVNMVVSYSLCSGIGPLPAMGWTGIAVGTAIGHCCGAAILIALLVGGRAGFHLRLEAMQSTWLHAGRGVSDIGGDDGGAIPRCEGSSASATQCDYGLRGGNGRHGFGGRGFLRRRDAAGDVLPWWEVR
jgi:Na+-driven multidrug efflux pump